MASMVVLSACSSSSMEPLVHEMVNQAPRLHDLLLGDLEHLVAAEFAAGHTILDRRGGHARRLAPQQSSDFYEVILERHRRASTIVTGNRAIDEWIPLFDDPILA
jgi:hypothetical protein